MKKNEKVLMAVFGCGIAAFIADFLIETLALDIEPDYHFFNGITRPLSIFFIISFFGIMTLLVKVRLRKRFDEGKEPISKGYRLSFILSFIPFVLLVISCLTAGEFNFMGTTVAYGAEAFWDNFFFTGIALLSIVIPVFPVIIYWQLLYIINRRKYRKK